MVRETDYCGIVSGSSINKVDVCGFNIFYGVLGNVPLIEQCPVNMECTVTHILKLGSHLLIVGQIEECYISDSCLTDGKPDISKIRPFTMTQMSALYYQTLGETIGKTFSIGKQLIAGKPE